MHMEIVHNIENVVHFCKNVYKMIDIFFYLI
jgi:hypothetical protein